MSFSEFNVAFSIYALLKWYDLFAKLYFRKHVVVNRTASLDEKYGSVRVHTDILEFVNSQ